MRLVAMVSLVVLAACSNGEAKNEPDAEITENASDARLKQVAQLASMGNSPDKALSAYIEAANLAAEYRCYSRAEQEGEIKLENEFSKFFTGDAAQLRASAASEAGAEKCVDEADKYAVDIKDVEIESSTRAVVIANLRNVTQIPDGAEPDEDVIKWRKDGQNYRFILNKDGPTWKIAQAYEQSRFQEDEWTLRFNPDAEPQIPWFVILPV